MKIKKLFFIAILLIPLALLAQTAQINEWIAEMTLEDKAKLVVGMGMNMPGAPKENEPTVGQTLERVPGAAGSTCSIPELNIPSIVVADGPAGLRISPTRDNDNNTYYATAFPIASLLSSTWDTKLIEKAGQAIGKEALEYGVDIILMPALNLHRNPLCGRNFEYYSEDPLLAGTITAAMVNGIQAQGVGTSIKHFAANNQETNRMAVNVVASERALRELYLKGFEIAVKQSNPWTVMSSYNKINGTYTSESYDLLTTILRDDWGFKGFVMTDWFGGKDAAAQMQAGNDLLMPGRPEQTKAIIDAVNNGALDIKVLDANVARILNIIMQTPVWKKYPYSNKPDLPAHAQIARAVAAEGMVLLKNNKNVLPLQAASKIALFGNSSYNLVVGGTGSGDVNEAYSIPLEEGLKNAGFSLDESLKQLYVTYMQETKAKMPKPANWFAPVTPVPQMPAPVAAIQKMAEQADLALVTIGRISGEFVDRKLEGDFNLDAAELDMLAQVAQAFHAKGKKMVVVLNIGGVIETASWRDQADAILLAWQPGQEGGYAIADVLRGQVNPSGKLPMTFPVAYRDVPSAKNFPGIPEDKPDKVVYEEDIFVGYRYYNTFKIKTAYEFGYGLSYTEFDYGKIKLSSKEFGDDLTVSIKITNKGKTAGKEVVQLYIGAPRQGISKPESELRAFAKTSLLQPGQSETLTFKLHAMDLASFDTERTAWFAEAGEYKVKIGSSSTNIKQTASFTLAEEQVVEELHKALAPQEKINIMKYN